jgi:hypothetical protein
MLPSMANRTTRTRRTLPRVERVRRGWVFRDADGRGWWVDDTIPVRGTYRVVPAGHAAATCRIFTPMLGTRDIARRTYQILGDDDRDVSATTLSRQLRAATAEPAAARTY